MPYSWSFIPSSPGLSARTELANGAESREPSSAEARFACALGKFYTTSETCATSFGTVSAPKPAMSTKSAPKTMAMA